MNQQFLVDGSVMAALWIELAPKSLTRLYETLRSRLEGLAVLKSWCQLLATIHLCLDVFSWRLNIFQDLRVEKPSSGLQSWAARSGAMTCQTHERDVSCPQHLATSRNNNARLAAGAAAPSRDWVGMVQDASGLYVSESLGPRYICATASDTCYYQFDLAHHHSESQHHSTCITSLAAAPLHFKSVKPIHVWSYPAYPTANPESQTAPKGLGAGEPTQPTESPIESPTPTATVEAAVIG